MKLNRIQIEALRYFSPQLEKIGGKAYLWIAFLLLLIAFGMYGLYEQVVKGHGSGLVGVVWGLLARPSGAGTVAVDRGGSLRAPITPY